MQVENPIRERIARMEAAYADLLALARTYPPPLRTRSGACGEWSAQQVLAHLCGWFAEARRRYRAFQRGSGDMRYNVDAFNIVSLWQRRSLTYEQILAELEAQVRDFAALASQIPPERLARDPRYVEWLDGLTREALEHAAQLSAFQEEHA